MMSYLLRLLPRVTQLEQATQVQCVLEEKTARHYCDAGRKSQEEPSVMVAVMFKTIRITSAMRCQCNNSRLLHVGQTLLIVVAQQHSIATNSPTDLLHKIQTVEILFSA